MDLPMFVPHQYPHDVILNLANAPHPLRFSMEWRYYTVQVIMMYSKNGTYFNVISKTSVICLQ
jgi:hypothetical protein